MEYEKRYNYAKMKKKRTARDPPYIKIKQGEFFRNVFAQGERAPLCQALAWYGMASKNGRKNGTDRLPGGVWSFICCN